MPPNTRDPIKCVPTKIRRGMRSPQNQELVGSRGVNSVCGVAKLLKLHACCNRVIAKYNSPDIYIILYGDLNFTIITVFMLLYFFPLAAIPVLRATRADALQYIL